MKKNYQEIVREFEKLDYRELSKAIFYFEKFFELTEQHNLNEQQTNLNVIDGLVFNLCERLAELLGDKEAIADLKRLYDKHPEMFSNMQEVSSTIKEVVEEPEIIVDANRDNRDYKVIKAAKALNDERMADVVIKEDLNTKDSKESTFKHQYKRK